MRKRFIFFCAFLCLRLNVVRFCTKSFFTLFNSLFLFSSLSLQVKYTMYDHEPSENDSSNRIQPTFFHTPATQLNNPPKKSSQDPAKNPYYQSPPPYSLHSPNQSEPSAPPLEPEVYPPGRSEAYPPVGPYSPVGPETYPPAGPYSPQGVYPPTNYNHPGYPNPPYSNYGAVPPYPNTSDASPSWPWMAPPANGNI